MYCICPPRRVNFAGVRVEREGWPTYFGNTSEKSAAWLRSDRTSGWRVVRLDQGGFPVDTPQYLFKSHKYLYSCERCESRLARRSGSSPKGKADYLSVDSYGVTVGRYAGAVSSPQAC